MKKVLLSMAVVALLATSCKEAKKGATDLKDATVETTGKAVEATKDAGTTVVDGAKDAANAVVDKAQGMVESALEGVSIPEFANEAVTKNLTEYAAYAKDYIAANGNLGKISALAPKGAALLVKGKELASKLDVKELAKYKSVLSAIQSKMAPSK
ncbi:MAG: hypothetical protein V3V28_03435 [Polaribacter sp.]|uniref:hypothetical protein n=1 Tax=Polaribacter sp. TaxID=1920175 RepID=UPI002F35AAE5